MITGLFFSADMNIREIKKVGFEVEYRIVTSEKSMVDALIELKWDLIIHDNSMKNFNITTALQVRNKTNDKIPFIVISEDITEEAINNIIQQGCNAYLSKDRLPNLRKLLYSLMMEGE